MDLTLSTLTVECTTRCPIILAAEMLFDAFTLYMYSQAQCIPCLTHMLSVTDYALFHAPIDSKTLLLGSNSGAAEYTMLMTRQLPVWLLVLTSNGPCFQTRSPATPRGSWFTAMTSPAVRICFASLLRLRKSAPMNRGDLKSDHRAK